MKGINMDKAKIEELLDNLTLGLKADPEVRLDVKSELRSHLEAKIEEGIQSGLSEEASEEQALKSFGDTIQISDDIADANSTKMSFKARLKVFAGILLVPAVIICALISFDPISMSLNLSPFTWMSNPAGCFNISNRHNKVFWFFERYTPEEKLILYGDKSKKTRVAQQKAIWERFPDNKAYLANYIIILLSNKKNNQIWREEMFSELKMAEQKDPDNALYNYITTGLLLEKACKIESKRISLTKKDRENGKRYKATYSLKIKDRKLMNQAIEEYLKGTQKKYFKSYVTDIVNRRFDIMGNPKTLVENINQISVAAGILLPHISYVRNIPKSLWLYAEELQKGGRQKEALRIVKPWRTYIKQITQDVYCLIEVLVDNAVASVGYQIIPNIYCKAGKISLANSTKQELLRICAPVKNWKAKINQNDITKKQLEKTGALGSMLLPALGEINFTEKEFSISRKIEYTAVEKAGIVVLNGLFMIAMASSLLTALYWRIRSKQKALLLAPSQQLIIRIFLSGIVLPLTAYVLISISGILGGHEYNLMHNAISLAAQFFILLTIIPAIIFILIRKYVHQRCMMLDIPCPETKQSKTWRIILITIFSIFILLALLPIRITSNSPLLMVTIIIGSSAVVVLITYILILIAEYLVSLFSGKQYALYYGALAKTIVPIFALAMIFMTLIFIPYLNWREADLISKDKVMYGQPKIFTHVEHRVTQKLKTAMLKALE